MIKVFVYGSLKVGFHNHYILEGSEFIGDAVTSGKYSMLDLGSFPGVDISNNKTYILGEVYNVDPETFRRLDSLEGYPDFYNRVEVVLNLDSGAICTAWMYYLVNPSNYYTDNLIEDGFWEGKTYHSENFTDGPVKRPRPMVVHGAEKRKGSAL